MRGINVIIIIIIIIPYNIPSEWPNQPHDGALLPREPHGRAQDFFQGWAN